MLFRFLSLTIVRLPLPPVNDWSQTNETSDTTEVKRAVADAARRARSERSWRASGECASLRRVARGWRCSLARVARSRGSLARLAHARRRRVFRSATCASMALMFAPCRLASASASSAPSKSLRRSLQAERARNRDFENMMPRAISEMNQ